MKNKKEPAIKSSKFKSCKKLIREAIEQYKLKEFKYSDSWRPFYSIITKNEVRITMNPDATMVWSPDMEELSFHDVEAIDLFLMVSEMHNRIRPELKPIEAKLEELMES